MPDKKKLKELSSIFHSLGDMCDDESENSVCGNLSDETIQDIGEFLMKMFDVKIGYKTAQRITGIGINALYTRASRDGIKPEKHTLFPFKWILKIKKK